MTLRLGQNRCQWWNGHWHSGWGLNLAPREGIRVWKQAKRRVAITTSPLLGWMCPCKTCPVLEDTPCTSELLHA